MNTLIKKISKYSDNDLQNYFNTEKLDTLHKLKLYLDDIYYNTGKDSGLKDYQYDMLKETLDNRDPDYVVPVGARIREGENRIKLPYWLGSMDKFKPNSEQEIKRWLLDNKATQYNIEYKLDGVSCLVISVGGKTKLYTRGDGIVGADISYLAQYFKTIPKLSKDIAVRGELIMSVKTFTDKYSDEYANPRNMVAGRVNAKEIRPGLTDIEFIAYEIVGDDIMPAPTEQLDTMKKLGFKTVPNKVVDKDDLNVETLIETLAKFTKESMYEIDGIIVQSNIPYERNTSGNPSYAFAFKVQGQQIDTEVLGVTWNISKWGQLKPTVELKPIKLSGVLIKNTTGFNANFIEQNSIGPGAIVKMIRSGEVIPYILEVISPAPDGPEMPDIPYRWNKTRIDIIAEEFGPVMCIKLITDFFKKLGIKHVAEKGIEKMYEDELNTLFKILAAPQYRIAQVPGFGEKGAERIYTNIHSNLKDLSLPTVLGASGIFGFGMGRKRTENLFNEFPNILEEYSTISSKELYEKVLKIEGFSDITAKQVIDNISWANRFIKIMQIFATFKSNTKISDVLKGKKIVFSGFRDAKLEEIVVSMSGKMTTSISSNTNILVVASKGGVPTGKFKKAMEIGTIEILSKQEFIDKYINE